MLSKRVGVPWFKHDDVKAITRFADAYRKAVEHAADLLLSSAQDGAG